MGQKPPPSFPIGAAGVPQKPDATVGGRHLGYGPLPDYRTAKQGLAEPPSLFDNRTEPAKNKNKNKKETDGPAVLSFRLFAAMPNCEQRP